MITKSNLKNMLSSAGFSGTSNDKYEKTIHFLIALLLWILEMKR